MLITPPVNPDYGFYNGYVTKAPDTDLITALKENWTSFRAFVHTLSEEELLHRYAAGKWSIKEVLVHLIDAERSFCYRIMRISRADQAQLPGYSVDDFISNSFVEERDMANIMLELEMLRKSTIAMFEGMHPDMLDRTGPARDVIISPRALGFAIVGHLIHHTDIIRGRYLVK